MHAFETHYDFFKEGLKVGISSLTVFQTLLKSTRTPAGFTPGLSLERGFSPLNLGVLRATMQS